MFVRMTKVFFFPKNTNLSYYEHPSSYCILYIILYIQYLKKTAKVLEISSFLAIKL